MKLLRKLAHYGSALFLALALLAGTAGRAYAAQTPDLEMNRTGSISLTLKDGDGNAVSGGAVTLYQVAALSLDDGNMAYAYTSAFADCTSVLDVEDTGLAAELASYVAQNSISGTTVSVGADGKISFSDLALGLYLLVQTSASDSYETINPFVVTIPMEENGVWVYTVDASPKVGTVTATEPETPDNPETPDTPDTPETSDTPETVTLPQTGQLNWPIPMLAAVGILFLFAGWLLSRSDSEQKQKKYAA